MEQYYVIMPESTSQNVLAVVTPNFWGHMTASSTSKIRPAYSIGPACSKLQNFTICFAAVYSRRLRSNFPRLPRAHHQKSRDSTLIRNLTQLATSCPRWQLKFQDSYPIFLYEIISQSEAALFALTTYQPLCIMPEDLPQNTDQSLEKVELLCIQFCRLIKLRSIPPT